MSIGDMTEQQHQTIWLQPWCDGCESSAYGEGRMWCQDDVWGHCDECGRAPVKYMIAPDQPAPKDVDDGCGLITETA